MAGEKSKIILRLQNNQKKKKKKNMADNQNNATAATIVGVSHDLNALLATPARDFLIRNTGEQVKINSLKGKTLALYIASSGWSSFTPILVDLYNEVSPEGLLDVIFVSSDLYSDQDEETFRDHFSMMPWLAIPFSDKETRDRLFKLFDSDDLGGLQIVVFDENGRVTNEDASEIIGIYGAQAYPFTAERMKEVDEEEEKARREQTLRSLLVTDSTDFVISSDGNKVPVSELEGKTVCLFFWEISDWQCWPVSSALITAYKKLKEKGENFEVVLVPINTEEEDLKHALKAMPWYSLPSNDKSCMKLVWHFEIPDVPTVVVLGPDGKTLNPDVVKTINEHGDLAYPFTPEKLAELEEVEEAKTEVEEAKTEAQTLESLLVSGDLNYVIGKDEAKVLVSDLVGKTILLYFCAHWCRHCRELTPKLIEVYHKIKAEDEAFEVITICSDIYYCDFEHLYSKMPWLALPYRDRRNSTLCRIFKVTGIPLVALGPSGKILTKDARDLVSVHGADAYPFTEERLKEIETKHEETAKECEDGTKKETEESKEGWV